MSKKRKKKVAPPVFLSAGLLPTRLAGQFAGRRLIFTDASRLRHGGIAALLYTDQDAPPQLLVKNVPLTGSNELEFLAVLLGLALARQHCPGLSVALFSDNQDAISRFRRAKALGLAQDPQLAGLLPADMAGILADASFHWIKGHGSCRGNALADQNARAAAA